MKRFYFLLLLVGAISTSYPQNWQETARLLAPDIASYDYFGHAVAIHAPHILVSAIE